MRSGKACFCAYCKGPALYPLLSPPLPAAANSGYQLGELNEWSKKTNDELAVRVPLLVRAPWKAASVGARTSVRAELLAWEAGSADAAAEAATLSMSLVSLQEWALQRRDRRPEDVWLWVQAEDARCLRLLLAVASGGATPPPRQPPLLPPPAAGQHPNPHLEPRLGAGVDLQHNLWGQHYSGGLQLCPLRTAGGRGEPWGGGLVVLCYAALRCAVLVLLSWCKAFGTVLN